LIDPQEICMVSILVFIPLSKYAMAIAMNILSYSII